MGRTKRGNSPEVKTTTSRVETKTRWKRVESVHDRKHGITLIFRIENTTKYIGFIYVSIRVVFLIK
jgi:hypothetical protein